MIARFPSRNLLILLLVLLMLSTYYFAIRQPPSPTRRISQNSEHFYTPFDSGLNETIQYSPSIEGGISPADDETSGPQISSPTLNLKAGHIVLPTLEEYAKIFPKFLSNAFNPEGLGCVGHTTGKSVTKPPSSIKGCPNPRLAAIHGNLVYYNCSKGLTYTFMDHHVNEPITFPLNEGRNRTFLSPKSSPFVWPESEEYLELHCDNVRQYFSRVVQKPSILAKKLADIPRVAKLVPVSAPNIIIILVDSVSRAQAVNLFPNTMKYLATVNSGLTHRFFSFNRLNSPDHGLTISNMTPLFAGRAWDSRALNQGRQQSFVFSMNYTDIYNAGPTQPLFLWDRLKDLGYVTFFGSLANNLFGTRYWKSSFDHLIPAISNWAGDPPSHLSQFMYNYAPSPGPCYAGKRTFEHLMDHAEMLMNPLTYPGARKFGLIHLLEAHRSPTHAMYSADNYIRNFIIKMQAIPNTVVYFASDHGPGNWDRRAPFLHLLMPRITLTEASEKNLFDNQFKLISHFDLHETLKHIIIGQVENPNQAASLAFWPKITLPTIQSILEPLSLRECGQAGILARSCFCAEWITLEKTHPKNQEFVSQIVKHINAGLHKDCMPLTLKNIGAATDIRLKVDGNVESHLSGSFYIKEGTPPASFNAEASYKDGKFSDFFVQQVTTYSVYNSCRPPNVNPHTCICKPE